jgi:hypothetical protein
MDMRRISPWSLSICFYFLLLGYFWLGLAACGNSQLPTPSTASITLSTLTQEPPSVVTSTPLLPLRPTPTLVCTDNLTFIADVTIPDNTVVTPGSTLDKQWLVQNSGDCNWDGRYRLRLISGDALGATVEQALYPARAGTQANIRILFISPQIAGEYVSEWQAFDANGLPFGDSFFIKIIVQ